MVGLLCTPLSFVDRLSNKTNPTARYALSGTGLAALNLLSPPVVLLAGCLHAGVDVETVLMRAALGWDVWGMWTQVVVWGVWWPAWLIGCTLLGTSFFH
jgi:glycosylphosphatidylinositol transamidase